MTYFDYFWKKKLTIGLVIGVSTLAVLIYTALQPFEYRSTAQMIVVHQNENLDSYTASRAAERSAKTLSNVVGTTSFFESVLASDAEIQDVFGVSELERRDNWNKSIEVAVTPDTGVLTLSAYSKSAAQAEKIAGAAVMSLATQQWKYLGAGTSATVEMIDAPLTSSSPVRPNIVVNVLGGVAVGLLIGMSIVVLRDPQLRSTQKAAKPQGAAKAEMPVEAEPVPVKEAQKEEAEQSNWRLPNRVKEIVVEPENSVSAIPDLPREEPKPEESSDEIQNTEASQGASRAGMFTMQDHLKSLQEEAMKQ